MNATLKSQIDKTLALALMDFKDENEALTFLKDFLTKREFDVLAKRLAVAYWLTKKRSYENIQNNLKVSSATIAEGNRLLKKSGVKSIIRKIDADEWANKWSTKIKGLLQ